MTVFSTPCQGPLVMDAIHLGARVHHQSIEEFEAGFADRVTVGALFLAREYVHQALVDDVAVGARVHVELLLPSGQQALACDGVVAWSMSARAPPGREPGIGVVITHVDDATALRLRRMAAVRGAGSRVRVPGQRIADHLKFGSLLLLLQAPPSAPPCAPWTIPSATPSTPRPPKSPSPKWA